MTLKLIEICQMLLKSEKYEVKRMRKMYLILFLLILLLAACGKEKSGLVQINYDTASQFIEGEKNGFFLVVYDKNESYLYTLDDVAKEKEIPINYYYLYQPDGSEGEIKDEPVYMDGKYKKETLIYMEDGEAVDTLRLRAYEGVQLKSEIENFLDIYSKVD